MGSKFLIASAIVLLSFGVTTVAQSQRLEFEVVSVRPVKPIPVGGQRGPGGVPGAESTTSKTIVLRPRR